MSTISTVTAFLLMLLVAACASPPMSMVTVPDKLKPGANESLAMIVPAKGVQIYECRARKDQAEGYEWAFVAPEADLFDARGNKTGRLRSPIFTLRGNSGHIAYSVPPMRTIMCNLKA